MTGLSALVEAQKQASFTDPSTASDEEALGILLANHLEWDGAAILRVTEAALEDANFHTESEQIATIRESLYPTATSEEER